MSDLERIAYSAYRKELRFRGKPSVAWLDLPHDQRASVAAIVQAIVDATGFKPAPDRPPVWRRQPAQGGQTP